MKVKQEELHLRTMRNIHVKYLKMIRYAIEHRDLRNDYDGSKADELISKISRLLDEHDNNINKTKFYKKNHQKPIVQKSEPTGWDFGWGSKVESSEYEGLNADNNAYFRNGG